MSHFDISNLEEELKSLEKQTLEEEFWSDNKNTSKVLSRIKNIKGKCTGPKYSVIGMDINVSIKRFETTLPERYKIATGECIFNAVILDIDEKTNKVRNIQRINI